MERRLTAILAADVVGYSRLMGIDEAGTLTTLKDVRTGFIDGKIAEHQGRVVKLTGDGILAEFPSVVNAVACAVELQRGIRDRNADVRQDRRIQFRIGVNLGDVIVEGDDIYGDGVNVAARLEGVAKPGGIAISHSVRDQVGNRLDLVFEDMGEQKLKNIERPIRVYNVSVEQVTARNSKSGAPAPEERPSIAVLPFNNMSGDPEQEYFSDGITEDIITDLSKVSGLSVVARHTAFTYKNRPVNVQEVGRELGVAYVLEGSVRKAGARVRVTGQLINSKNGNHVWADRFDRELTDIFAIQDEITHAIVEQLKVKLHPQERKSIAQAPTDNIEAYTYYLKGRDFLNRRSKRYLQLARQMFAKAVDLDPMYARAYAGMADCDSYLYMTYHEKVVIDEVLATAEKALSLDRNLAEAHASRGVALSAGQRYEEAKNEFKKALALDPDSYEAHYFYARSNFAQGNVDRAAALFERAAEIRPGDYQVPCLLVSIYKSLGRPQDAKNAARKGVELAERELTLYPEDSRPAQIGSGALLALGEKDRAREWTARALAIDPDDLVAQYNAACTYSSLGDVDAALDLLEQCLPKLGHEKVQWAKYDSDFDPVRNHPRYQRLFERIDQG
ncbi:MAG: adenylate/guanylate cyclase domain-containing protein [Verrucomicrobia bacterium]|nr:MAG: adenylate/guanylate cyclase domain-containing protein [Verrucomicrobiota bacterium]